MQRLILQILLIYCLVIGCQSNNEQHKSQQDNLKINSETVSRVKPDTIFLKLNNGTVKALVNNFEESWSNYISYSFSKKLEDLPFYEINITYYEGTQVLLVSQMDGKEYLINSEPKISPDNKFIATASFDLDAHYNVNALNIWRIDSESLKVVFSIEPITWGPSDLEWLNDSVISFTKNIVNEYSRDSLQEDHRIELKDSVWVLN